MDDLISRQAAIDACIRVRELRAYDEIEEIKALPSAQQNRLERAIAGKSPEEIYDFLWWLMFDYARAYTDSRAAVIVWLEGESNG